MSIDEKCNAMLIGKALAYLVVISARKFLEFFEPPSSPSGPIFVNSGRPRVGG
jgi:hypothetical protein